MTSLSFWNDYGIVAYIAEKVGTEKNLGKTKLQKLVYLLKVVKKIKIGYDFRFYNYGPYSSELAGDLDYLNSQGVVNITYDPGFNSYDIRAGENTNALVEKAREFLSNNKNDINEILNRFGMLQAKELELLATIVFFTKAGTCNEDKMIKAVREVKPKFSPEDVRGAIAELKGYRYI